MDRKASFTFALIFKCKLPVNASEQIIKLQIKLNKKLSVTKPVKNSIILFEVIKLCYL